MLSSNGSMLSTIQPNVENLNRSRFDRRRVLASRDGARQINFEKDTNSIIVEEIEGDLQKRVSQTRDMKKRPRKNLRLGFFNDN